MLTAANLTLRFLLELAAVGALGYATRADAVAWVFAGLVAVNMTLLHGLGAG